MVRVEFRITKCRKHSCGLMCGGQVEERRVSHRWPAAEAQARKLCYNAEEKGQGAHVKAGRGTSPGPCLRKAAA